MILSEALQINYELAELAIQQVENSNFLVRWQGESLMEKLREIQLKSDEFLLSIHQTRRSIERNISMIEISEPLDSHYWAGLLNSMQLYDFVLSRVEEEKIPETRAAIERINDQVILFQQAIQPEIINYNVLVQSLRSFRSKPFYINSLIRLPKTEDLPVVLNASRLTTF
ncbi:MAG TPA: hypothetical protein VM935_16540 [Chitinophagaceae bacterium]|jgi:hypothetical protein|nr:hypothetical protein [Chitinophagaceae bacterium]